MGSKVNILGLTLPIDFIINCSIITFLIIIILVALMVEPIMPVFLPIVILKEVKLMIVQLLGLISSFSVSFFLIF